MLKETCNLRPNVLKRVSIWRRYSTDYPALF